MICAERFGMTEKCHLELHGVDLVELCNKYGTPLFVFDSERLRKNYRTFCQAFRKHYPKTIVCYSIKTNYNLAICNVMQQEGAYAEVASGLDFYVAKRAGFTPKRIIFDGLYKSEIVLREAVSNHVFLVNVESFAELEKLDKVAGELGSRQAIGLRINLFRPRTLDIYETFHCNPSLRFGFPIDEAYAAFKRASKMENLEVVGIMTHPYHEAAKLLLPIVEQVHKRLGIQIKYLNFGGGFNPGTTWAISTRDLAKDFLRQKLGFESKLNKKTHRADVEEIAEYLTSAVRQSLGNMSEPTIILEPGSYIVSDAGLLLLRVDHIKQVGRCKWIIVDGGTNLIPHYMEQHKICLANRANAPSEEDEVNIAGPLLYIHDFIAIKRRLPKISEGDILAVFDSGAYTLSKSTQFLYPRPSVLLVNSEGKVVKIRERETFEDVTRMDGMA